MATVRRKSIKAWEKELKGLALEENWELLGERAVICIEQHPESDVGYYQFGNAKLCFKQFEDAIIYYICTIEINSKHYEAYNNRGLARLSLEQYTDAKADFDSAIEINDKYYRAYNNRGTAKNCLKQYANAIPDFDRAIELNDEYHEAYNNWGVAKNCLEQYEEAILDFDRAIELNDEYYEAYHSRGVAKLGLYAEAIADFDKAIELNPSFDEARDNRAIAVASLSAQQTQERVIETYEDNIRNITATNHILELYQREIEFSRQRLYGISSQEYKLLSDTTGSGNGDATGNGNGDGKGSGNDEPPEDNNSPKVKLNENINRDAVNSFRYLIAWLLFVVSVVSYLFFELYINLCQPDFKEFCETGWSTLEFHHIFHYTFTIAILSTPSFFRTRFMIRRAEHERTILLSLIRDRIILLFWAAQEPEDKTTNRSKLAPTIADHLTANSSADISLTMLRSKLNPIKKPHPDNTSG